MTSPAPTAFEQAVVVWVETALDSFKAAGQTKFRVALQGQPAAGSDQKSVPELRAPAAYVHAISEGPFGHAEGHTTDDVLGSNPVTGDPRYAHRVSTHWDARVGVQVIGVQHRQMAQALEVSIYRPDIEQVNKEAGLFIRMLDSSVDVTGLAGIESDPRTAMEFRAGFARVDSVGLDVIETVEATVEVL